MFAKVYWKKKDGPTKDFLFEIKNPTVEAAVFHWRQIRRELRDVMNSGQEWQIYDVTETPNPGNPTQLPQPLTKTAKWTDLLLDWANLKVLIVVE